MSLNYIKKEDLPKFIKTKKTYTLIVLLSMALVFLVMVLFIFPQLLDLYNDLNQPVPDITKKSMSGSWIVISCIIFIAIRQYQSTNYEDNINKLYASKKDNELINVRKELFTKQEILIVLVMASLVTLITLSLILPIYNLTSSF